MLYNPTWKEYWLWKGIADYFKIEIINLMIDTNYIFAINNTDIKIQKVSCL